MDFNKLKDMAKEALGIQDQGGDPALPDEARAPEDRPSGANLPEGDQTPAEFSNEPGQQAGEAREGRGDGAQQGGGRDAATGEDGLTEEQRAKRRAERPEG